MSQLVTPFQPDLLSTDKTRFNVLDFIKAWLGNEATIDRAIPEPTSLVRCGAMLLVEAIVTQPIAPGRKGQVKFQGSWWTARCDDNLAFRVGDIVHVIGRQNLTLYIKPAKS